MGKQASGDRPVALVTGGGRAEGIGFEVCRLLGERGQTVLLTARRLDTAAALGRGLEGAGILVDAVCPGFTATFPGAEATGARPVSEDAAGIVWAAALPTRGPDGGLFRDGQLLPW